MTAFLRPRSLRATSAPACALAAALLQACGGGGDGDSSAASMTIAECLGVQARGTPGVTTNYSLRSTAFDAAGNVTASQDFAVTQYVNEGVVFEGAARTEFVLEFTSALATGAQLQLVTRTYLTVESATRFTEYGSMTRSVSTGAGTTIVSEEREVDTPPTTYDGSGGVGSTATTTTTSTTTSTTTFNGVAQPTSTTTDTRTDTVRFAAVETITVPAGTYSTCRLEDGDGVLWFIPGTGVYARSEYSDANGRLELRDDLLSLTRNGAPL